jgi:soluble lytic murein transglycosylase
LLGISAYNAGPNRARAWLTGRPDVDLWVELTPFVETRRYTKRVLSSRAAYSFIHAAAPSDPMLQSGCRRPALH